MDYEKEIIKILKKEIKIDNYPIEVPKDKSNGDYAFPCFILAKEMKKSPVVIAQELANKLKPNNNISKIIAVGPYLNFFVNSDKLSENILSDIYKKKDKFGVGNKKKDRIMIEYSQANTHKAFHVGHIRGTSIGEALSRILKHDGYNVVQANYQGDTGTHVAKWIWCYNKFHKGQKPPKKDLGKWIASIYVEAAKKSAENNEFLEEIYDVNHILENKTNKDMMALWRKSRQWSLDELEKIYTDLDAHFDHYFFERQMEEAGQKVVKELLKKGLAEVSEGATIINLKKYKLGVWVLLRKDGTILYSAKDIALAKDKFTKYKIDKSIYVIGNAQSLHMQQLFKTLELLKYKQAKDCYHLAFDEVRLPTGKMSSRTGVNILYDDMKDEIFDYTYKETVKRHPDWSAKKINEIVLALSIGALKFDFLSKDNNKVIVFDTKKACDFEGETGPYVQYAHVRCCSILEKYGKKITDDVDFSKLSNPKEEKLIKLLANFTEVVKKCSDSYKVHPMARYLIDVAQGFNEFYHDCHVITDDKELTKVRVLLVDCTRQILLNGLTLLAIKAPKKM